MVNFDYMTPTRLIFGKGVVDEKLCDVMKPLGKRVLLTYGGGSIKRIGLYDKVKKLLKNFEIFELAGIEPNPKYSTSVLDGVKICKENAIDVILSVGGGSVLDCSKAIAAGACYDGETWDLLSYAVPTKKALPIVDIMTLSATGSEYDAGAVISRTETNDKIAYIAEPTFPVCSFLDPQYTYTVNAWHTAAGVADAVNHILEQYFAAPNNSLADGFCEAGLRTLMKNAPIAIAEPENYQARAEIMLACTYGCNGIYSNGNAHSGWSMHAIEHALSAYYDITHGVGLAIITPRWMKHILSEKTIDRFISLGSHLFGIDTGTLAPSVVAEMTITAFFRFFESIGIPMHLREVGIDESRLAEMAHHVAENEKLDEAWKYVPLSERDILEILKAAL